MKLKKLFCKHEWKHTSTAYGNIKECSKCGKVEPVYMGWV